MAAAQLQMGGRTLLVDLYLLFDTSKIAATLLPWILFSLAAPARAQTGEAILSIPPENRSAAVNAAVANARYVINSTLSSRVANALFVMPRIGRFNMPRGFAAAYNSKWGDFGARVAPGTQVNFGNYECNQTTAQTLGDTAGGGNHCFGGTIDSSGSAWNEGVAISANVSGPGVYYGVDLSLNNNNEHTSAVLYWANCIGTATCGTAFKIGRKGRGDFAVGLDLAGHNIVRTSSIDFAAANHAGISGASADVLRIYGGGSAGGMIIAGSTDGGRSGPIRFRRFATSSDDAATIDPASGNIVTVGKVEAARGVQLPVATVFGLPRCDPQSLGLMYFVTDANTVSYRARAMGGGRTGTKVTCDGVNWLYM